MYQAVGGRASFRIFACVAAATHLVLLFSQWLKRRAAAQVAAEAAASSATLGSSTLATAASGDAPAVIGVIGAAHLSASPAALLHGRKGSDKSTRGSRAYRQVSLDEDPFALDGDDDDL